MKKENLIMVLALSLFFFGMSLWAVLADNPDYSESERRVLAKFPKASIEAVMKGDFAEGFDAFAVDTFPARDWWRGVKAYTTKAFLQKDNHEIYTAGNHIVKMEYPLNTAMLDHAADVMKKVDQAYLDNRNVYFAIVPDKNRYLAQESGHLALDYEQLSAYMQDKANFAMYIEIADLLDGEDYYYTDSHWKQENLVDVADRICLEMGVDLGSKRDNYTTKVATENFSGVYLGQSALKWPTDTIKYLTNDVIDQVEVEIFGIEDKKSVYDLTKVESRDPYEMFLSGNQPVVTLRNPDNPEGKRLLVFRDSFASSLAPLMIEGYREMVLVDLRYISSDLVGEYVDFDDGDVLFIYGTSLLNSSLALK